MDRSDIRDKHFVTPQAERSVNTNRIKEPKEYSKIYFTA